MQTYKYASLIHFNRRSALKTCPCSSSAVFVICRNDLFSFEPVFLLQMESLTGKTVRLETITPGGAIGFSSLIEMGPKRYISDAKTLTPVEVLRFIADDMMILFHQNFELGFLIMKKTALIAKRRLMYRTLPIPNI